MSSLFCKMSVVASKIGFEHKIYISSRNVCGKRPKYLDTVLARNESETNNLIKFPFKKGTKKDPFQSHPIPEKYNNYFQLKLYNYAIYKS